MTNTALQTKLDDVLKDYAKKSDLKAWLTSEEVLQLLKDKDYMTRTEIETLIGNSVLDEDDVKGIFNNMLTGEAIMGKIQTDVQEMISDALDAAGYMTGDSALSTSQGKPDHDGSCYSNVGRDFRDLPSLQDMARP